MTPRAGQGAVTPRQERSRQLHSQSPLKESLGPGRNSGGWYPPRWSHHRRVGPATDGLGSCSGQTTGVDPCGGRFNEHRAVERLSSAAPVPPGPGSAGLPVHMAGCAHLAPCPGPAVRQPQVWWPAGGGGFLYLPPPPGQSRLACCTVDLSRTALTAPPLWPTHWPPCRPGDRAPLARPLWSALWLGIGVLMNFWLSSSWFPGTATERAPVWPGFTPVGFPATFFCGWSSYCCGKGGS